MDKVQLFEDLNQNIQNLDNIERQISKVQLAMYEKSIQEVKERKIDELRDYFERQAKLYNQKTEKCEFEIEDKVDVYKLQMEKLITAYNNTYVSIFKMMQDTMNTQKLVIADMIRLVQSLQNDELDSEERLNIQNKIMACAQKKLNLSVIVEECKARINWCIESVRADIDTVFVISSSQLQVYKEDIFTKIRRIISNKMSGKNKFKKFLENYESEFTKNIETKNNSKILDVCVTLKGVRRQIACVEEQIAEQYKQMIYG